MSSSSARSGVIYALSAYLMWGIAPVYFRLLDGVGAEQILVHRVVWSFLLLLVVVVLMGRLGRVRAALRQPRNLGLLAVTSLLIGGNWLVFIWAINHERMLEASLGYYINPLVNVMLGMLFLGERLRKLQWWSLLVVSLGVAVPLLQLGYLPWVSLFLAFSFGGYGLLRKKLPVDAFTGLLAETALLLPLALLYWCWFMPLPWAVQEAGQSTGWLLLAAGVVTTAPLLCFNAAAQRLQLSTLGFFQYIGPSMMFLLAVFVYGEPLDSHKLVMFLFIWAALVMFVVDALWHRR